MVELSIHGLCRTFKNGSSAVEAVRSLDLEAPAGSFTVVVGKSGCGKTTLLRLIAGLEKPDSGDIRFKGGINGEMGMPRVGFMFQDARLLPWLTVEENLGLAFHPKDPRRDAEIGRTLELVGLKDWSKAYPRSLSGGMAQRAALARALCRSPDILLLDEPFGALDAITRGRLRKQLDELWRKLRVTIVLVTHDIEEAVYLADRVIVMKDGRLDGEIPVSLSRPRNYREAEFQTYCRFVEEAMDLNNNEGAVLFQNNVP